MLKVRRYTFDPTAAPEAGQVVVDDDLDPSEISDVRHHPHTLLWVDLVDADERDLAVVADEFELHALAMEDARKHGQRPKLERYHSHAFLVAYDARLSEVDLFIGPCWIITVRARNDAGEIWDPAEARARFDRVRGPDADTGMLLATILDTIVDGYFDVSDRLEDRLESLEDRIFGEELRDERAIQQQLFDIRRQLLVYRRSITPVREVVNALLRQEVPWVRGEALLVLQDVYDHVLRAIDLVDGARELMGNAVDAHLAIISNRINQIMKKLTSWGAILFGASLIAGIYGMNFDHMPELHWWFGYPLALGSMLVMTFVLRAVFKRRDWL